MPGGCAPAGVAGSGALLGEPTLKVTLACAGEVMPREGEETVSRFRPAAANSLSSVDWDDIRSMGNVASSDDDFLRVSGWTAAALVSKCVENTGDLYGRWRPRGSNESKLEVVLKFQIGGDGHGSWLG